MMKKALALSVLAAISSQAGAFQLDTGDDWNIRWDNTLKGNLQMRTDATKGSVVNADPSKGGATAPIADDGDFSVNRKSGGISSGRVDWRSEMDVVWRGNFGVRVSGAGWYDFAYENSDNPKKGTLPKTGGTPYDGTWAGLTYAPGDYSDEAEDLHYRGGELLDAFVFGNWDIGNTALGVRAGRHTIFWGQSLLGGGAITGIAGAMTAIDGAKALSVPGTEAQELFLPSAKISSVFQVTDNLTLNAYYEFEHRVNRNAETGSFWSPVEVLTENSQCFVLAAATSAPGSQRTCFKVRDNKYSDSGEWGFNLEYTIEAWNLETSFVYINSTDRTVAGVYGSFFNPAIGYARPEKYDRFSKPWDEGGANANVAGEWGWAFKEDIDTYGIAFSKQAFDISFGMDIVYRKDAGLNPNFPASIAGRPGSTPADFSGKANDYPGATGDVFGVVVNGFGLLNSEWGLWDGGIWIIEYTTSWLDDYAENEQFANPRIHKGRVTSQIASVFRPTWYQIFPGWDLTVPMTVSYGIDGEQPPQGTILHEELGNASVGVSFKVDEVWFLDARYSAYFGPTQNGTSGPLNDRDNVSLTVKRTF
jgi:hypothetical protein